MKLNKTLILGLVALSSLTASAIALSGPTYDVETVYFSDATKTTIVGESEVYCTGKHSSWGTTSAYYITDRSACGHGGPCSPIGCELAKQSTGAVKANTY